MLHLRPAATQTRLPEGWDKRRARLSMHEAIRERNIGINLRQRASRILVFPIAVEHIAETRAVPAPKCLERRSTLTTACLVSPAIVLP